MAHSILEILEAIEREGSVRKAAESLGVTAQAISYRFLRLPDGPEKCRYLAARAQPGRHRKYPKEGDRQAAWKRRTGFETRPDRREYKTHKAREYRAKHERNQDSEEIMSEQSDAGGSGRD